MPIAGRSAKGRGDGASVANAGSQLDEVVRFLGDPRTFGESGTVRSIETHWSWVFLTSSRAFKLKKPISRPWIDLRTPDARRANCQEELRLNRRLTEGIYHRVVPLTRNARGELLLGEEGTTVDWLLEMSRLPEERILDSLLRRGRVSGTEVDAIGRRLAEFYANQPPVYEDGRLYIEHLGVEASENRRVLETANVGLTPDIIRRILDRVDVLLRQTASQIEDRVAEGRVIEGHGDLRPEHICLVEPVQIFDCLEFDRGMRILDPFDEVNYLGLECGFLGAGWIRPRLLTILEDRIGGRPPTQLMALYGAFRAVLRARICLAHLDDEVPMEPERWPGEARAYLRQAGVELDRF